MKKFVITSFALALAFSFTSCSDSNAPKTEAGDAQEAAPIQETSAQYVADASSSSLEWTGRKVTGEHYGHVNISEGVIAVENQAITGGNFTFNLTTLESDDLEGENKEKLEGHLKSGDFFEVEKYPSARFEIVSVNPYSAADAAGVDTTYLGAAPTHTITGNLTLKDSTKSVSFPAVVKIADEGVQAKAKFVIDRTSWGLHYGADKSLGDKMIYKEVELRLDLKAGKQA